MFFARSLAIGSVYLGLLFQNGFAQISGSLPRATPESEGVSSEAILQFLDATARSKTEFHSFMLLRHGKVIAEGWWSPYRSDLKHTLYSCSKSFTATAIGLALHEKRLALSDQLISFFPDARPDTVSRFLSGLTIQDVLEMSDGQEPDPTGAVSSKDTNWIKGFLATPIKYEPGTRFLYNSLGTYMLSAVVQKVTGQKTLDYLQTRLFDPLAIRGADWETDLQGINTGGWGLRLKTEDMAKFALLFLQKGRWNGKQVLPADWVQEASTAKIMQDPSAPASKKDSSDWLQGYCYQMWRCRHDCYRGDGAFGQFMIVMPSQDAVLAITAETPDMQEEINLVWNYLLPGFHASPLQSDVGTTKKLQQKTNSLALPLAPFSSQPQEKTISGKTFSFASNQMQWERLSFNFSGGICRLRLQSRDGTCELALGDGSWQRGETNLPVPSLTANALEKTNMLYPAKIAGSYSWNDSTTLTLVLRYLESPHRLILTCRFHDNKMAMDLARSFDFGNRTIKMEAMEQ